jgi:hypothetical protein
MPQNISGAPQDDADAQVKMAPFAVLIGEWTTETTHPALPGVVAKGRERFEWVSGQRFLTQYSENDHPDIPDSLSVIGVMEGDCDLSMQYFDSRGANRRWGIAFDGREVRIWRDAPGFAQRITMKLSADREVLEGVWQLDQNDEGYKDDLAITYRRSKK